MYRGYKIVAVTPAGRPRFLEILMRYSLANRHVIDRHDLWINTLNIEDIVYMKKLSNKYPNYIQTVVRHPISDRPIKSMCYFYDYCIDDNTIYIKFDDDICHIAKGSIESLLDFRINNPDSFIVYPVTVCNGGMERALDPFKPVAHWKCTHESTKLEHIRRHLEFLSDPFPQRYSCKPYVIPYEDNISINCICWFGKEFAKFNGYIPPWPTWDEQWLGNFKPHELQRPNMIDGNSLVVHFSYSHSMTCVFLETHTDFLKQYLDMAIKVTPIL